MAGEEPNDTDAETWNDVLGYRDALTWGRQMADAREFAWHPMMLNGLHYIMQKHRPNVSPGRFRAGEISVTDTSTGTTVYRGPDADDLPALMTELTDWLNEGDLDTYAHVRAAMAHLNLVSIHPWRDGNGRMSRCVQTLVMAREGELAPVFSSIEEWLGTGRNTYDYYDALAYVQRGRFAPGDGDTLAWVRFNLRAHHLQAQLVRRRTEQASKLWIALVDLAEKEKLPERNVTALYEAIRGGAVRRSLYQRDEDLSVDQAARDLRELTARGLLDAKGETKGRRYEAAPALTERAYSAYQAQGEPAPPREPYGTRQVLR